MKLVAFSPWKHTTTCISSSKGIDTIIPNLITLPSNTTNQPVSKRRKKSKKEIKLKPSFSSSSATGASDVQPVLSVTSNHQLCVLGHHHNNTDQHKNTTSTSNSPKTILRQPSSSLQTDEVNLELKQVSQWIYNSRPDPTSSFLPEKNANSDDVKNLRKIGAVIDPLSKSIFVLQNNNQTLKVWNLDDDVNGPDDNYFSEKDDQKDRKIIQSIEFDSPVMSMDMIRVKQRQVRHVKIKGTMNNDGDDERMNANGKSDANIVVKAGVTGILSNGQMYVLLVCSDTGSSANYAKLGLYGAKRNSQKRGSTEKDASECIFSIVGFNSMNSTTNVSEAESTMITSLGQKRKLDVDTNDGANNGWGKLSLSVVSRKTNNQQETSLTLTKHCVTISSLKTITQELVKDGITHKMIGGVYETHEHHIKLPNCVHDTKKNGHKNKGIFVTQLDLTHIGVAYHTVDKNFCATIIDTKASTCILKPITLSRSMPTTETVVTDIGGLSSSILAVLTSDAVLSLYDLRRPVKLHEVNIRDTLGTKDNGVKYQYRISTHWFTGTICILYNARGNGSSKANNVSICSARVGVYDSEQLDVVATGRKPFVKGQYNLARIIASSMETDRNSISQSNQVEVNQVSSNMMDWLLSTSPVKKSSKSYDTIVNSMIIKLEHYRDGNIKQNGSKQKSFMETFEEIQKKLQGLNAKSSKSTGNKSLIKAMRNFPQAVIDVSVSVAISIILSKTTTKKEHKADATKVLIQCIQTGLVSGRNHFDTVIHENHKNDETLRSILFTLQSQSKDDKATPDYCSPLNLISNLLQYCKDGLTEQMLVSMTHFILCHATEDQFSQHWEQPQTSSNEWYSSDSIVKVLEKRLCKAKDPNNSSTSNEDDVQKLVNNLEKRLAVSRQLHFIEKIVTHSKCNPALLRMALQSGLTQANSGEVGVLIQALGKILRRVGKEKKDKSSISSEDSSGGDGNDDDNTDCNEMIVTVTPNKSTCISQWLSALIDANLATLMRTDESRTMQQVQKEVSVSIAQTKAILSLKELLCQVDRMIDSKKKNSGSTSSTKMEVVSLPPYSIEKLIF